jgi:hypothetical protein
LQKGELSALDDTALKSELEKVDWKLQRAETNLLVKQTELTTLRMRQETLPVECTLNAPRAELSDVPTALTAAQPHRHWTHPNPSAGPTDTTGTNHVAPTTGKRRNKKSAGHDETRSHRQEHAGILYHSRFPVGIEAGTAFNVVKRLVGPKGINMKNIVGRSGAKVWIRGLGSRHPEGDDRQESTDPLMIIVSATASSKFLLASGLVKDLLESVYADYALFCQARGLPAVHLEVRQEIQRGPKGARAQA